MHRPQMLAVTEFHLAHPGSHKEPEAWLPLTSVPLEVPLQMWRDRNSTPSRQRVGGEHLPFHHLPSGSATVKQAMSRPSDLGG